MLADAQAALERLEAMPRPEEIPAAEAKFARRKPIGRIGRSKRLAAKSFCPQHATSEEEFMGRKMAAEQAQERYNKAVADYNLLKAGALGAREASRPFGGPTRKSAGATGANRSRTPHSAGARRWRRAASQRAAW